VRWRRHFRLRSWLQATHHTPLWKLLGEMPTASRSAFSASSCLRKDDHPSPFLSTVRCLFAALSGNFPGGPAPRLVAPRSLLPPPREDNHAPSIPHRCSLSLGCSLRVGSASSRLCGEAEATIQVSPSMKEDASLRSGSAVKRRPQVSLPFRHGHRGQGSARNAELPLCLLGTKEQFEVSIAYAGFSTVPYVSRLPHFREVSP
jgi:hypothetical protein